MAKMFYTMEETKSALGRNEEDIKQLAREGRLREFRDGPRLMFKADQVEQLKGEIGTGEASLGGETGAPIGLAGDSKGGSSVLPMADSFSGKPATAGDTAFADPAAGSLSGSVGGVPSPAKGDTRIGSGLGSGLTGSGLPGSGLTGTGISSAGGTRSGGVTVFDVDDRDRVDPSAQTQISPGGEHHPDAVGSGSGLLDLTRESDDTSLGAVFDELGPGGSTAGGAGGSSARRSASAMAASALGGSAISPMAGQETQAGEVVIQERTRAVAAPVYVEAADPVGEGLGWAALGGVLVLMVGMFILGSAILGHRPDLLKTLTDGGLMYLGIGVGVVIILFIIGFVTGRRAA